MASAPEGTIAMPAAGDALRGYAVPDAAADLYSGAPAEVQRMWRRMAGGLAGLSGGGPGGLGEVHDRLSREVMDLGTTFRLSGDKDERPWPLSPMPLLIGTEEWAGLTRGLIQRAGLLEQVIADIYGPQALIAQGHLPAAVVAGSPYFARKMQGVAPPRGRYLQVYAVDLARGPGGKWRVLADRLRLPTGIGYALENRLAISRTTGTLLSDINARRLAGFFAELRDGIAASCSREMPRIALLTPGQFNQSYTEQAHLARYLGFPLVEGRDLAVSRDRLYVRTIAGLKRVDAVWRWIGTEMLDPLAFDAHSRIGVPDMFDAWSSGELVVANWPGVGVVQARAMSAFLPRLADRLLGESLLLPNMATWWCGQDLECRIVKERIDDLVISSAFGSEAAGLKGGRTRAGASLDAAERAALFTAMDRRPIDYVGQEIVHLSTTPTLIEGRFEPRPFTLRAFVARGTDGQWVVMPGGFARMSAQGDLRTSLIGEGDFSADVCIVDEVPVDQLSLLGPDRVPPIRRAGGILASQAADNLFWLGRYSERAEVTVRIVRNLLGSSIDVDSGSGRGSTGRQRLVRLLLRWGAIPPAAAKLPLPELCARAFRERELSGGIAALVGSIRDIGRSLRDRVSADFWRVANQPPPPLNDQAAQSVLTAANKLIDRLSVLSGLASENMARSPAWHFYDLGRRIERATTICRVTRQLAAEDCSPDDLGLLLDLFDSQITYRSRYLVGPMRSPVADLLLLDPGNPRGLAFQLDRIAEHLAAVPRLNEDEIPEAPFRQLNAMLAILRSLEADSIDDAQLRDIETRLLALSDAISQRYFLQYERADPPVQDTLLA
ncbi:MAG: circularly permuted type 2 ATP-grasp protein [Novosphingobium sp.]